MWIGLVILKDAGTTGQPQWTVVQESDHDVRTLSVWTTGHTTILSVIKKNMCKRYRNTSTVLLNSMTTEVFMHNFTAVARCEVICVQYRAFSLASFPYNTTTGHMTAACSMTAVQKCPVVCPG